MITVSEVNDGINCSSYKIEGNLGDVQRS